MICTNENQLPKTVASKERTKMQFSTPRLANRPPKNAGCMLDVPKGGGANHLPTAGTQHTTTTKRRDAHSSGYG